MIPQYSTITFCDIWEDVDSFKNDLGESPFTSSIKEENKDVLYYLLYARYGNNPIANRDIEQWKFKVFSIIFQYGPAWERRLEIQKDLREMPEEELLKGSKQIYNHAFNPSTDPSTSSLEELNFINDQNTSNYRRGKLDAYTILWDLLRLDVTEEFIRKFQKLFKIFVGAEQPLLYITEEENDE